MKRFAPFVLLLIPMLALSTEARQGTASLIADVGNSGQDSPKETRSSAEIHADVLMVEKDFEFALDAYKDILVHDPQNALILNKAGIACQQLGNLNEAERFYRKASRADKKFANVLNNLGTLDYERSRYGRAIKSYKKALTITPNSSSVYSNLGYAYYASKQYPLAMQAFDKALALDPTTFEHKGGNGPLIEQRSAPDPGLFFFLLAKSFAKAGDAERTAHYLKLSRDDGYKDITLAAKDPQFASVIKDPRVQEVLRIPSYAQVPKKPATN